MSELLLVVLVLIVVTGLVFCPALMAEGLLELFAEGLLELLLEGLAALISGIG